MRVKLDRLHAVLICLCLGGYPTVAAFSALLGQDSNLFSYVFRVIVLGLSVVLIVGTWGRRFRLNWPAAFLFAFWAIYLMRMFWDTNDSNVYLGLEGWEYWAWGIGACLLPAMALMTIRSRLAIDYALLLSLGLMLISGVVVANVGSTFSETSLGNIVDTGRLQLASLNPISVGHLGLSLCILSFWCLKEPLSLTSWPRRLVSIAGIALGIYLILASASRGPILALIAVGLWYLLCIQGKTRIHAVPFAALVVFGVYQGMLYLEESHQSGVLSRIHSVTSEEDMAISGRLIAYKGALEQFLESPLWGSSLEERITGSYPHNILLESLMATGFSGGVMLMGLMLLGVYVSYWLLAKKAGIAWVGLIYFQYFVAAQFSGAIYNVTVFWAFLAVLVSVFYMIKSSQDGERNCSELNV